MTYFVHENVVTNADCGGGDSFAAMGSEDSSTKELTYFDWGVPLATPADGTGGIVPLAIYPPSFDLSSLLIFDPAISDWLKGSEYSRDNYVMRDGPEDGPPPPPGGGGGGGGVMGSPETGFYRVVRVGPHLLGVTNGMVFSDVWEIPVEVGSPAGELVTVTLTENGSPIADSAIHVSPFELPVPVMILDTTLMSNGIHQIAAIARWQIGGTNEDDSGYFEADCPPVSIVVSNEISFPNWMPYFGELGDSLLITAQSAHADTDYWIDIYGANAGYIGTFSGHTSDGNIYGWWDLVGGPPNYIHYTNEPWFQFKISTEYIDPPTPISYKIADPWLGPGDWVIVAHHAFDHVIDHETLYEVLDGFISLAQGSGLTVRPTPPDGHAFGIRFKDPVNAPSDWNTFRQALYHPRSRNLAYFGHGGPNGFGYNQGNTNLSILASEIQTRLGTASLTNRHAYRLVIVDGCSTGAGKLPESFGIVHKENVPRIDYANASMRMSAFVGWDADKSIAFLNGSAPNYDHIHFIQWIKYYLALGNTIKRATELAADMPDVIYVKTDDLKIYGCWDLTFWAHNN